MIITPERAEALLWAAAELVDSDCDMGDGGAPRVREAFGVLRAEIAKLREENARMREALEDIREHTAEGWTCDVASRALGRKP